MRQQTILYCILVIAIGGLLFSGYLSYQELFSVTAVSCPAPGATGTVLGYPACVYGFFMYLLVVVLTSLAIKAKRP
ncbi:MAG: hypothetical protein ACD_43C00118G0004 [uncultured bacterium]|nr:MAG: hypothetical protein ACD_43C00118G0004 [uncultured bacterium]